MNWAAWGPTVVAAITMIFTAGTLVTKINRHDEDLKDHGERLDNHDKEIGSLDVRVAKQEAWRDGYNAGKAAHH